MPNTIRPFITTPERQLDRFSAAVEAALQHFSALDWLDQHSPLAAPFLLGAKHTGAETRDHVMGQLLQQKLRQATNELPDADRALLRVAYLERDQRLNDSGVIKQLGMTRRTYYRHRLDAITNLADAFLRLCRPALRPEQPTTVNLVGRSQLGIALVSALTAGMSAAMTGLSGVGKTALATQVASGWHGPIFWFTVRPGFNDQVESLLFALADFFRTQGADATWRQVAVGKNKLDVSEIVSVIRFDVDALKYKTPLICIDEIDLLDLSHEAHAQIYHVLDSLRTMTPVLFVGQQLIIDVESHHHVPGLSVNDVAELLQRLNANVALQAQAIALHRVTRGLPVLVRLCATLYASGDSMDDLLSRATTVASVELLVNRLWRRLNDDERALLLRLSVLRERIPSSQLSSVADVLQSLAPRRLIEQDEHGTVALLPHLRLALQQHASPELLRECHLAAAEIMEACGEYLEATYHYSQAQRFDLAVWLWYAHREVEMDRGRGVTALSILKSISADNLTDERDRVALHESRAALLQTLGTTQDALAELDRLDDVAWASSDAHAKLIRGELLDRENRLDESVEAYRAGIELLRTTPTLVAVKLHKELAYLYRYRIPDSEKARREARLARFIAEMDSGSIESQFNNQETARQHFETAIKIGDTLEGALPEKVQLHGILSRFYALDGSIDLAIHNAELALRYAEQLGSRYMVMAEQNALISFYNDAGRYTDAYALSHETQAAAMAIGNTLWIAATDLSIGETCRNLGYLEEAEQRLMRAIQQEEESLAPDILIVLAKLRDQQTRPAEAITFLKQAIEIADKIQDAFGSADALRALGDIQKKAGDIAATRDAWTRAMELFAELGLSQRVDAMQASLAGLP